MRLVAPRAVVEQDGVRAVLLDGLLELGDDNVPRLVPRDALPLALAALAGALHGVADAHRRVHELRNGERAAADGALGIRSGAALDAHEAVVLHVAVDAAPAVAVAAGAGDNLRVALGALLGVGDQRLVLRAAGGADAGQHARGSHSLRERSP